MTEAAQLNILRTSSEVRRLLERDFDFSPLQTFEPSPLFHLDKNTGCELIAKDGSGGEFALCQSDKLSERPLLYVSSEGQAGIMGRNLNEGLSIVIAIPYWEDCLKFSGNGQLIEMRRVIPFLESEALSHAPHLDSSRQSLRKHFSLENISDPVQSLYAAVTEFSPLIPVFGSDDWKFDTLFNKFTVQSNPSWRKKLSESAKSA